MDERPLWLVLKLESRVQFQGQNPVLAFLDCLDVLVNVSARHFLGYSDVLSAFPKEFRGIVQKAFFPKSVPRIFRSLDAFLVHFGTFLFCH